MHIGLPSVRPTEAPRNAHAIPFRLEDITGSTTFLATEEHWRWMVDIEPRPMLVGFGPGETIGMIERGDVLVGVRPDQIFVIRKATWDFYLRDSWTA